MADSLAESLGFTSDPTVLEDSVVTPEPFVESVYSSKEVHTLSKESVDFLAALVAPSVFRYFFPAIYLSIWKWLLDYVHRVRDFSQLAIGLPRGFAKTFFIKVFLTYVILFTTRKFIVVFCENQTKGNNIVADVMDMLSSENVKKVFGDWKIGVETDRQDLKKFGFRGRNITFLAGTIETIRGISLKNERPDVMIFDDIQSRQCADSQVQSEALEREMIGTAMKAKSPHGCLYIFVGNMYPTKWSILKKLKGNANWIKFIVGGILANGESLWEELQPIEQLMREFENDLSMGHPEIFYAEVLNDENASVNDKIDLSKVPEYKIPDDEIPDGSFIMIDPSGGKVNSDDVAIGYFELHERIPVLRELINAKLSPGDTIREALRLGLSHNCRLIAVESVAYQATLCYWFEYICLQHGVSGFEVVEVYPGSYSKNSRILGMFKSYMGGEVKVHPSVKAVVELQMIQFNPLRKDNTDDILDLLTYPPKVIELYGAFIESQNTIQLQDFSHISVPAFNSPF